VEGCYMKTKTMDIIFFHISCVSDATDESESQEHNELVDDKYLQVLIQLRNMDLLFKKKKSKVSPSGRIV
jgi:hypothetical protein